MPGIAQVWLTHNELEDLLTTLDRAEKERPELKRTRTHNSAKDKLEMALKPVACEIASGSKTE